MEHIRRQKDASHVVFCPFLGDTRKVVWQQRVAHPFDLTVKHLEGKICCMKRLAHWHKPSTAAGRMQVTTWGPFKISRIKKACMWSRLATASQDWLHSVKWLTQVMLSPANSPKQLDLDEDKTSPTKEPFPCTSECAVMSSNTHALFNKAWQLALPHHSYCCQKSSEHYFWHKLHSSPISPSLPSTPSDLGGLAW